MFTVRDHYTEETVFIGSKWHDAMAATTEANTSTIFEDRFIVDEFVPVKWKFDGSKWYNDNGEVRYETH